MNPIILCILCVLLAAGCGGPSEPARETQAPAKAPEVSAPSAAPAEPSTSSISGSVRFNGTAPSAQRIRMGADPACEAMHSEDVHAEDVLVNDDGTLRNVFVYVKSGLGTRVFPPTRTPIVLDQVGCVYRPHVQGVQAAQPIVIRNSDSTLHNVHALPQNNPQFNVGQPVKGMETIRMFGKAEVMVKFKCDVHPWMSSYIGVLDHPYHAVTGDGGVFQLSNLPAGEYVVEAWHEKFGTQTQSVKVDKDETKTIEFVFGN